MSMPRLAGGLPAFDDLLVEGYQHVVETGRWDGEWLNEATGAPPERIDEARRALTKLRVIERDTGRNGGWRAVSPRVAMAKLVLPVDAEVQRRAVYAERLRERLRLLLPIHEAKQRTDSCDVIDMLADETAVIALTEDETARCTDELLVMRGTAGAPDRRGFLHARDRGVRVRALFQHAAHYHPSTVELVGALAPAGVAFRTSDQLAVHVQVFDRTTCVVAVPDPPHGECVARSADGHPGVAVVVRHPLLVSMLVGVFEEVWGRGTPFTQADPHSARIEEELRRSVLRLLATGAKDDAVARKLGISLRTCRRLIAGMMERLGAGSRFQAGVEAQRQKLV